MLLENIKLSELPSIHLLDKDKLPNCACIYFISDSKGQIIYIGRTLNLVERWKDHHRFNQLKRFNRKDRVTISWMTCSNDVNTLSNVENELIKLYKPPLNWSRVVVPVRKITPAEIALQQSLHQLAKLNTMIFGFDPIADEEPPTIYLMYPVYGRRGTSGSIRIALKNINKKASSLKWKEYATERKSLGKFGYWETEYNGIRIDLSPLDGLINFMDDSTRQTVAGVEFMAFSRQQLETLLEKIPDKESILGLDALEDDPIPIEPVHTYYPRNGKHKSIAEIEWEELEPMPEGEARVMTRQFLYVDDVEIEVCTNENEKYFVRHNVYWWIVYGQKNPDYERNYVLRNLQSFVDELPTIKWSGYRFRIETIVFSEDDVEVESTLLPLAMFEDLIRDKKSVLSDALLKEIQSGEYKSKPDDGACKKLCAWLQCNSLCLLLQTNSSHDS